MNLLIVDDERATLEELVRLVEAAWPDIKITACDNPKDALERAGIIKMDAALLDIEMPLMDGLELANHLVNCNSEMAMAFVTAYNNYAAEAFDVNAIDYVLKPVRPERLVRTMEKLIAKAIGPNADLPVDNETEKLDVEIKAFGKLEIKANGKAMKWKRRHAAEVFACLLHNDGVQVHKCALCDKVWPDCDEKKALVNLQTAMWQLRKSVAELSHNRIKIDYADSCYRLTLVDVEYDVNMFEAYVRQSIRGGGAVDYAALEKAVECYTGGYLETEGFAWGIPRQQRLELIYKNALEKLIDYYQETASHIKLAVYLEAICRLLAEEDEEFMRYFSMFSDIVGEEKAKLWQQSRQSLDE